MQRLVLLASVCYAQAQHKGMCQEPWPKQYRDLVLSVHGENICTQAGRKLAADMEQKLQPHQTRLPLEIETKADSGNTAPQAVVISVVNAEIVKQVINLLSSAFLLCHCQTHCRTLCWKIVFWTCKSHGFTQCCGACKCGMHCYLLRAMVPILPCNTVAMCNEVTDTCLMDSHCFQAVNWDRRIEEAASQLALGQSLPSLAESGIGIRSLTSCLSPVVFPLLYEPTAACCVLLAVTSVRTLYNIVNSTAVLADLLLLSAATCAVQPSP